MRGPNRGSVRSVNLASVPTFDRSHAIFICMLLAASSRLSPKLVILLIHAASTFVS